MKPYPPTPRSILKRSHESWNTCNEFTAQYASVNALGVFMTYSSHVGARVEHSEVFQTAPAQSPQRVRSKMIDMLAKCWSMVEVPLLAKSALGSPQPVGSGLEEFTSAGVEPRGKDQILMKSEVHSVAKTAPWLSLKALPNVMLELSWIEQPKLLKFRSELYEIGDSTYFGSPLPSVPRLQSVPCVRYPVKLVFAISKAGEVCKVIPFWVSTLTPSTISISPPTGQSGPTSQKAGHVPQPVGICCISTMKRP